MERPLSCNNQASPASVGAPLQGLTIAICTKDRISCLMRCIDSICTNPPIGVPFEVLVVNDGQIAFHPTQSLQDRIANAGGSLSVVNKKEWWGEYRAGSRETSLSRWIAMQQASFDTITYLDDDVEIMPGYFEELLVTLLKYPEAVGVGGTNILSRMAPPLVRRIFEYIFLLRSPSKGCLTLSGFNWSNDEWLHSSACFYSEFLLGCNMTLRRDAIRDVRLDLYGVQSLAEDLFLSVWATRHGPLVVNPRMRVLHYFHPGGRRDQVWFWQETVRGHWRVASICGVPVLRALGFAWSVLGLVLGFACVAVGKGLRGDRVGFVRSRDALRGVLRGALLIAIHGVIRS